MNDNSQATTQLIREWMELFTTRSMHDSWRYVKAVNLSMPQFSILMRLYYHGQCGIADMSERMEITAAGASQLVERLVQSGLVRRAEDPRDRRARQLTLTENGREVIEKGIDERYKWVKRLVSTLSEEQRAEVLRVLPMLVETARGLQEK